MAISDGFWNALRALRSVSDMAKKSLCPRNSRNAPLQLHDAVLSGAIFEREPSFLLERFLAPVSKTSNLKQEGAYPSFYNTGGGTVELLGLLIKEFKPETLLESGVANGVSTRKILGSFSDLKMKSSLLYSCDVDERVASQDLLDNPQFHFRLIRSRGDFGRLVESLDSLDFFYHDSDHSYNHQMYEYSKVWPKLRAGGLLVSDDINWSNAFLDFCKSVSRTPYVLCDTVKFSGVIQK
jgi:predicted O-methyltransferase YrrM